MFETIKDFPMMILQAQANSLATQIHCAHLMSEDDMAMTFSASSSPSHDAGHHTEF